MKLLVLTQKVDTSDGVLGFMHGWLTRLAAHFDEVLVITLYKGDYQLPENVSVYSLGKEEGVSKFEYLKRFYTFIFRFKDEYDSVFVHMNAEYLFLGGIIWKVMKKKVHLWYNHPHGSIFLKLSRFFARRIFCTSPFAYSKRYKKTIVMPAGIDTDRFTDRGEERVGKSVLMIGRISPVKRIELLKEPLETIADVDFGIRASIVGSAPPQDKEYEKGIHESFNNLVEKGKVTFIPEITQEQAVDYFNTHLVYVNLTPTGSFDKTIVEAMACGAMPLVTNAAYEGVLGEEHILKSEKSDAIAEKLVVLLGKGKEYIEDARFRMKQYAEEEQSLNALIDKLVSELSK